MTLAEEILALAFAQQKNEIIENLRVRKNFMPQKIAPPPPANPLKE